VKAPRRRSAGYTRVVVAGVHAEILPDQTVLLEGSTRDPVGPGEEVLAGMVVPAAAARRLAQWILRATEDRQGPGPGEAPTGSAEFEQEWTAFLRLKPLLVELYPDRYVAIRNGRIVDHHPDMAVLTARFFETHGDVPVCIGRVGEEDLVHSIPIPLDG